MSATLVLFAAGLGSRYGGAKQWASFGPSGQTLLDYTLFDALNAGFNRVLFVIRKSDSNWIEDKIRPQWSSRLAIDMAFQRVEDLPGGHVIPDHASSGHPSPPERTKPWGTGHALWSALPHLDSPFFVANADDVYGREALQLAFDQLVHLNSSISGVIIGYPLGHTLSPNGSVSRGICQTDANMNLVSLTEHKHVTERDLYTGSNFNTNSDESISGRSSISRTSLVSMNLIGFTHDLEEITTRAFDTFYSTLSDPLKDEFPITAILNQMIAGGHTIRVCPTQSEWMGVTYPEDAPFVRVRLQQLHQQGRYPDDF